MTFTDQAESSATLGNIGKPPRSKMNKKNLLENVDKNKEVI